MQALSMRVQWWLIGAVYAAVLGFAAVSLYARHAWEKAHLEIVMASSGMYAAGDAMLGAFILMLLLVPTIFLVRLVSCIERRAMICAKLLLALGLSAPVALLLFRLGARAAHEITMALGFFRLMASPFALALLLAGRLLVKFPGPRRLLNYALLAEGGTIAVSIVLILLAWPSGTR